LENRAEGDVDKLVQQRFFPNGPGVFVEVGAARPDYLSVSAHFRERGWKIIAIEPNPAYAALHEAKGYEVLPYACGDSDQDEVEFSVVNSHGAEYEGGNVSFESFSSLGIKDDYAKLKPDLDVTKIKVKMRRLDTVMKEHAPEVNQIDVVCVDVEGWELEVLSGLSFDRYRPKVLIIENMFFSPKYPAFMRERGYRVWRTIQFNEVYVRSEMLNAIELLISSFRSNAQRLIRRFRG
jgi:FkbM family methyltransferase